MVLASPWLRSTVKENVNLKDEALGIFILGGVILKMIKNENKDRQTDRPELNTEPACFPLYGRGVNSDSHISFLLPTV